MRVRHLQSHLSEQSLVHQDELHKLGNARVGVDAVFWLRSIAALKDPFADALGGIPPGIFGFVDKELESFKRHGMTPLFVFQGVAPGPQHSMFVSRMDQQMELAWSYLARGKKAEAQKCFAVSTSRINGDFVYFIFHHLRAKGYECLQAPYFAGPQLAHFAEHGVVSTVFGPPGLLLYGVSRVVIQLSFAQSTFDWVDLSTVLQKWDITRDQFVDSCMLAGTEYCLTYPYLNQKAFPHPNNGRFNFDAAVFIIKQAPIINWMQTFQTEEMRNEHVDGYCICKVLVQHSPVFHLKDSTVRPLGITAGSSAPQVPVDFSVIMGERLPNSLYYLMLNGIISHKLPQALAKGEWTDKSQPLVDTMEFRDLLVSLKDYREAALGMIARHLPASFQDKRILCKAFWDPHPIRQGLSGNESNLPREARILTPYIHKNSFGDIHTGLPWKIEKEAVVDEMKRQGVEKVDFKFCLNWHAHECGKEGDLLAMPGGSKLLAGYDPSSKGSPPFPTHSPDVESLSAVVHFMVLEQLGLIADDAGMTVLGNVLKDTPSHLQMPCLEALEMMKFGVLSTEPFDAAQLERPFPKDVAYPDTHSAAPRHKATLLLCRIMSLVPMKLKNDMWNADVDFDLVAFHSLVRILNRALRQLVEGSLASILLKDLTRVSLLPQGFMCASPKREDFLSSPAVLPTFMLPRASMGIVVKHFLNYTVDPRSFKQDVQAQFKQEIQAKFPCCIQPLEDLKSAFAFWDDMTRCVLAIAEPLGAEELAEDMKRASTILEDKKAAIFDAQASKKTPHFNSDSTRQAGKT